MKQDDRASHDLTGFSDAELRQIQTKALNYLRDHHDPRIINVGFGLKVSSGRRQRKQGLVLRVFVPFKYIRKEKYLEHQARMDVRVSPLHVHSERLKPLSRSLFSREIPPHVIIVIRRKNKRIRITLPTDVTTVGSLRATGTSLEGPSDGCHTGIAVALKSSTGATSYGLISVGHVFRADTGPIIARLEMPTGGWLNGTVIARSVPETLVDVSVIAAPLLALQDAQIISDSSERVIPKGSNEIVTDCSMRRQGRLLVDGSKGQPIELSDYFPEYYIPTLGNLENVVFANSATGEFKPGRSGAAWVVDDDLVGLQVAAEEPGFTRGVAQLAVRQRAWIREAIPCKTVLFVRVF